MGGRLTRGRGHGPAAPVTAGTRTRGGGAAPDCRGSGCRGRDAEEYDCDHDAEEYAFNETRDGTVRLWFSPSCQALWAEVDSEEEVFEVTVRLGQEDQLGRAPALGDPPRSPMLAASKAQAEEAEACGMFSDYEACVNGRGEVGVDTPRAGVATPPAGDQRFVEGPAEDLPAKG